MKRIMLIVLSGFIIISSMLIILCRNDKKDLFTEIQDNDIESVQKSVLDVKNINAKDKDGETALEEAVKADNKDIVKLLISKGADLNTMDAQKCTPLSVIKSESMMNLLLSKGANADTMVFAGDGETDETAIEVAKYIVAILPN